MDSWISSIDAIASRLPTWAAIPGGLALIALVAIFADLVAKRLLLRSIAKLTKNTSAGWDDAFTQHGLFVRLARIPAALVVYYGLGVGFDLPEPIVTVARNVAMAYIVLMISLAASSLLSAANAIYEQHPIAKDRPLKGFVQLGKIALFIISGVLIVAILIERSPVLLLSGLGAMTAVTMLIFKDTILSLVASVQLASLDMVRVGDWIEMPSCGADGDVVDIALHTIKVQNWDKTITTIPTHKLIANSFKNWRGMSMSGGRRIKRALFIDVSSIRFLGDEEVEQFKRFALLRDYIVEKEAELARYNDSVGKTSNENLRRLTNIGTFRAYVLNYLRSHAKIHTGFTLLVRQLQPGPQGLPLEIYAFTSDTDWGIYEDVQSDIFDHLLAIVPNFGLRVFQEPSGEDISAIAR